MFEQTFRNIDDILYKDSGADSELDYIGRTSWVMFLRYLDDLEQDKADEAALQGKAYNYNHILFPYLADFKQKADSNKKHIYRFPEPSVCAKVGCLEMPPADRI